MSIGRDVASAMGRHAAAALAGLLTIPLIARRLGVEGLGAWALIGTASFLLGLSDLGLATAVHRAAALRADPARARRVVGTAVLAILIVAPILAGIAYPLLLDLPGTSGALGRDMARAMLIAFPAGIAGALGSPFRAFALVRGGIAGLARARALASIAQVGVTAAGLRLAPTLLAPACGLLASALIETAMTARLARSIDPDLPLGPRLPASRRELLSVLRDGAATLALNLALMAGTRADLLILSRVGSLSVVAAYSVAARAVEQSFTLAKQTSTALVPRLGDPAARGHAVLMGTGMLGALVASGMAALVTHGQALLALWAGPVARDPIAGRALALLGLAAALASVCELPASALTLGGRTAWAGAIPLGIGCLANLAISLVGAPHCGVWAVAGGTVAGNLLGGTLAWICARRLLGWSAGTVGRAVLPAAVAGATSLGAGAALGHLLPLAVVSEVVLWAVSMALGCGAAALLMARTFYGACGRPRDDCTWGHRGTGSQGS